VDDPNVKGNATVKSKMGYKIGPDLLYLSWEYAFKWMNKESHYRVKFFLSSIQILHFFATAGVTGDLKSNIQWRCFAEQTPRAANHL
jgi:hypothetical protein